MAAPVAQVRAPTGGARLPPPWRGFRARPMWCCATCCAPCWSEADAGPGAARSAAGGTADGPGGDITRDVVLGFNAHGIPWLMMFG